MRGSLAGRRWRALAAALGLLALAACGGAGGAARNPYLDNPIRCNC